MTHVYYSKCTFCLVLMQVDAVIKNFISALLTLSNYIAPQIKKENRTRPIN